MPDAPVMPAGLVFWLRGDMNVTQEDGTISAWQDARGRRRTGEQPEMPLQAAPTVFAMQEAVISNGEKFFDVVPACSVNQDWTLFVAGEAVGNREMGGYGRTNQPALWSGPEISTTVVVAENGAAIYEFGTSSFPVVEANVPMATMCPLVICANSVSGWRIRLAGTDVATNPTCPTGSGVGPILSGLQADIGQPGFNGTVAELLLFDRELTEAEFALVETYLQARYSCVPAATGG